MAKMLLYGEEARITLARGVEKLARAIEATLGPRGGNAVIDRPLGTPLVSRDGVSIADEIELEDRFENMGAQIVREVAKQTNKVAGDGTTTAVVLANALIQEGIVSLGPSGNTVAFFEGMDLAVEAALRQLKRLATPVTSDAQLQCVALISAGDPVLGKIVAEAVRRAGKDGMVHLEPSVTGKTSLDILSGISIDRGYVSAHMANQIDRMEAVLDHPLILLTDHVLQHPAQIESLRELAAQAQRSLLVVAEQVSPEMLGSLLAPGQEEVLRIVAVHPPEFGHWRKAVLEDIAILTGGRYLSKDLGDRLEDVAIADLGSAREVRVSLESTTITGGEGEQAKIQGRRGQIQRQLETMEQPIERDKLEERFARMAGAAAIIHVGGSTPAEQKRGLQLAEDALNAVQAAVEEGVLAGGGTALAHVAGELEQLLLTSPEDSREGIRTVQHALQQPLRCIARNCGLNPKVVAECIADSPYGFGLNARTGSFGDLLAEDVLDPLKVTSTALVNALSVAKLILGTQTLIADKPDTYDPTSGPARGGGAERLGLDYALEEMSP
jgi:chaperonin GroEL